MDDITLDILCTFLFIFISNPKGSRIDDFYQIKHSYLKINICNSKWHKT